MALDEKGKPNIGPFSCGGLITIDNASHKVTRSGQYWAYAHYSKHVRRGAKVSATGWHGLSWRWGCGVSCGFRNPDGSFVVVLANRGARGECSGTSESQTLDVTLPANSVHTLPLGHEA